MNTTSKKIRSLSRTSITSSVARTAATVVVVALLGACGGSESPNADADNVRDTYPIVQDRSGVPTTNETPTNETPTYEAPAETVAAATGTDEAPEADEAAAADFGVIEAPAGQPAAPNEISADDEPESRRSQKPVPRPSGTAGNAGGWFEEAPPETYPPVTNTDPSIQSKDGGVNPTEDVRFDPLSTFALDVDTSSYTLSRSLVQQGSLPNYSTVRTEEFVNYFDQGYRSPKNGDTFAIHVDGTAAPFLATNQRIMRVGIQAERIDRNNRKAAHLTFVIDTSGSMEEDGKLELVKQSLRTMVNNLRADDEVAIVSFSDTAEVVLGATPAKQRETIINAIDRLIPTNSTNAEAGLLLGYDIADQMRTNDRAGSRTGDVRGQSIHRVILASDGVANVGPNGPDAILQRIKQSTTKGIELVTVGVGTSRYNDEMMERLADGGDGFSAYVDSADEADRLFRDRLVSTLQTVARDAKVQVEFDPQVVESYRLLGFENRAVADSNFRNDSVDAGEIGAGHSVTALYEITLRANISSDSQDSSRQSASRRGGRQDPQPLGSVSLRWDDVRTGLVKETTTRINTANFADTLREAESRLGLDVTVAAYAEVLRQGPWAKITNLQEISAQSAYLERELGNDPDVVEFIRLLQLAARLS